MVPVPTKIALPDSRSLKLLSYTSWWSSHSLFPDAIYIKTTPAFGCKCIYFSISKALVYFVLYRGCKAPPKTGGVFYTLDVKRKAIQFLLGNVMISMANNCCELKLGHSVQDSMIKSHRVIYEQFLFSLGNSRARRTRKRSRKVARRVSRRLLRGKRRFVGSRVLLTRLYLNGRRDCS